MRHGHGYGWGRAGDAGRLTLADMRHSAATESGKRDPLGERLESVTEARKAGHNRMIYTRADGRRAFRLIHTDVVTVLPSGRVLIQTGGWASMTTRRAIMEGLEALGCKGAYTSHTGSDGRAYPKAKRGVWNVGNVWGALNGAENSLMVGRYGEPEPPHGFDSFERRAIPFDGRVSFERNRDGSVKLASIKRDTAAKIRLNA